MNRYRSTQSTFFYRISKRNKSKYWCPTEDHKSLKCRNDDGEKAFEARFESQLDIKWRCHNHPMLHGLGWGMKWTGVQHGDKGHFKLKLFVKHHNIKMKEVRRQAGYGGPMVWGASVTISKRRESGMNYGKYLEVWLLWTKWKWGAIGRDCSKAIVRRIEGCVKKSINQWMSIGWQGLKPTLSFYQVSDLAEDGLGT